MRLLREISGTLHQQSQPVPNGTQNSARYDSTARSARTATDTDWTSAARTFHHLDSAHSPQAQGRVKRSFQTAQDRLVKGLRVACISTLERAGRYVQEDFLSWWNQNLTVVSATQPIPTGCWRKLTT